jgi:D-glycero-D-manno-heptose 1,7-bisphosphate phosphatase
LETLKRFNNMGYMLIIITNQGGISKGIYSHKNVEEVHLYLLSELKKHGVGITEVYYCPHHPSVEKCLCRKPDSLLIEKALARYQIDKGKSYYIGNSESDIEAALKAGIKAIKIKTNQNLFKIFNSYQDFQGN